MTDMIRPERCSLLDLCVVVAGRVMERNPDAAFSIRSGPAGCVLHLLTSRVPDLLHARKFTDAQRWFRFALKAAHLRGWL